MPTILHGRRDEQQAIRDLLDAAAQDDTGGGLLLIGDPGIGKTALLDAAAREASEAGMRVLRATGVESEAELPFASLHLLLAPHLDAVRDRLPEHQLAVLDGVLGRTDRPGGGTGSAPQRLITGLAVLGVLTELAALEKRPVVCVLDDAHWVDRASSEAFLIAMRRLHSDPVLMLCAARKTEEQAEGFHHQGVPMLQLGPLPPAEAADLLDRHAAGLTPAARSRILREADGNPLALTELPHASDADAEPAPGDALPFTRRLQLAFLDRTRNLPPGAHTLLTVAAAEEDGDLAAILGATRLLSTAEPEADLRAVLDAELLTVDGADRLSFRHPLLRAALRRHATPDERRRAHRALAEVLDGERRAWHRALAATGPDESVAAELERTARSARARGGHAAAAEAYQQAARLSTRPEHAAERLTLAAESALSAGRFARAQDLATAVTDPEAEAVAPVPQLRVRASAVHAAARFARGEYPSAHQLLLDAAAAPAPPPLAARLLLQDLHVAWYLGVRQLTETSEALAELPALPPDDPAAPLVGYVRSALRGILDAVGPAAGAPQPPPPPPPPPIRETVMESLRLGADLPRDLVQVCAATLAVGEEATAHEFAAELVEAARAQGADGVLPTVLFFLAEAELFHGRHRDALADATEALRVAEETEQRQWTGQLHGLLAYLSALDGDAERCRGSAEEARRAAGDDGPIAPGDSWALWALALLDLGAGRAEDALARLTALTTGRHGHTVAATHAVPDLVEAAVRVGRPEAAAAPLARFERWAAYARQDWSNALVQRCRALLAPDELAESYHRAARDGAEHLHRPFEHARSTLLYGEWLRRTRRRSEAQAQLRRALEEFERLGSTPWADRARTELRAAGDSEPGPRAQPGPPLLTPQELQVVRLAARGLSNRDIAARLFISPRTVGHHLYKAYPKLGVSSRTELTAVLD
jgi:DNA-binding CsgD family transcriptional regulator/tetratricopeptide (TPR) repeat protein